MSVPKHKMEEEDRTKILLNIDNLIKYTDYKELMDYCLRIGILSNVMKEQIELFQSEEMRHRRLLEKITHRGPLAFHKFKSILDFAFPIAAVLINKTRRI